MMQVRNLSFCYRKSEKVVLRDISFSLEEGEILTILGPNGVGKSTLLQCMAGLLPATSGDVLIEGKPLSGLSERKRARHIGYVRQSENSVFPYTVETFVKMGCAPAKSFFTAPDEKDRETAYRVMNTLGIVHLAQKPCTELSGGEYQQAMIARALMIEPRMILLDEPTSHLDYSNLLRVMRLMRKLSADGFTVVMTTHHPDQALLLGGYTALLFPDGRLMKDKTEKIVTEKQLYEVYHEPLLVRLWPEAARMVCIPGSL